MHRVTQQNKPIAVEALRRSAEALWKFRKGIVGRVFSLVDKVFIYSLLNTLEIRSTQYRCKLIDMAGRH